MSARARLTRRKMPGAGGRGRPTYAEGQVWHWSGLLGHPRTAEALEKAGLSWVVWVQRDCSGENRKGPGAGSACVFPAGNNFARNARTAPDHPDQPSFSGGFQRRATQTTPRTNVAVAPDHPLSGGLGVGPVTADQAASIQLIGRFVAAMNPARATSRLPR
jgi:hypothetical protein